jgi:DNA-binding transcriptional LysR family regulator
MPSDRFRELEVFSSVVDTGSFTAAARQLDCTPSAVSKQIDRLEARMGSRLIQRTTRSLALTQEGRAFHEAARNVLEALDDAESVLSDAGAQVRGTIRIHTTLAFCEQQLAPDLPDFLQRHALIRLEFLLTSDAVDLVEEDIDVSIQVAPVSHGAQVSKRIGTSRWVICASPSYLQRHGTPQTPEDLAQHNCLNFLTQSRRSRWPLGTAGQPVEVKVGGQVASNSDNFLRVLACQGMGIARLADFHVARDVREGRLVPLLSEFRLDDHVPIMAMLPSNRRLSPRVKAFLKFLEQRLQKSLA